MSRARDSTLSGGSHGLRDSEQCSPSLLECVLSLADVCAETHDAQQLLRNGTFDLKRLSRVLESQRVYMFVNESTVRQYKSDLTEEVEPQILELIERAKKGMKALEKKHHSMKTKSEHIQVQKATTHRSVQGRLDERRFRVLSGHRQNLERELLALESQLKTMESIESS